MCADGERANEEQERARADLRQRDGERDGLVELPPARLHGDDGRDGDAVAEHLGRQLGRDRLRLQTDQEWE